MGEDLAYPRLVQCVRYSRVDNRDVVDSETRWALGEYRNGTVSIPWGTGEGLPDEDVTSRADSPATEDGMVVRRFDFSEGNPPPGFLTTTELLGAGYRPPRLETALAVASPTFLLIIVWYYAPHVKYWFAKWTIWAGFSRLRHDQILESEVRERIMQAIREDPGLNLAELRKRVETGWGNLVYHLSVLERHRMVSHARDGRTRRLFPSGYADFSKQIQLAVLRNERARAFHELLTHRPGLAQGEIAAASGISRPGSLWHLVRLERAGLVRRIRVDGHLRYFALEPPSAKAAPSTPADASLA